MSVSRSALPRYSAIGLIALACTVPPWARADQRVWNPYPSESKGPTPRSADADEGTAALRQINWRRSQLGLPALASQPNLTLAAQRHSNYLSLNSITGHAETAGQTGFSGASPGDRLSATGYAWQTYGEVISAGQSTGPMSIESLMEAIYHRFGMLRSDVNEAGTGFDKPHPVYGAVFTMNLGARQRMDSQAGQNWLGTYPVAFQTQVAIDFYSDNESPDPVPSANRVGYPVSVQAASSETLTVSSFTLTSGGSTVSTIALVPGGDSSTPSYAAAIIPTQPLTPGKTYAVSFSGSVAGTPVTREWSFTTAPLANISFAPSSPCYVAGTAGGTITISGGSGSFTNVGWNSGAIQVAFASSQQLKITPVRTGTATVTVTDSSNGTAQVQVTVASSCPASTASDADRLFTWAEVTYPRFFAPTSAATLSAAGYTYRYYSTTNNYLGVKDGTVYFLDGYSGILGPVGTVENFLPTVTQAGY